MHDRIGFAPVPEGLDRKARIEFAAAFVEVFEGGAEQGLAEPARTGKEEVVAGLKKIEQHPRLVDVEIVRARFTKFREVADPERESG